MPAHGVGLGHLCHWNHWDLGLEVPGELQPYLEGVSLGAERVGQPVDGEGQVRHHAEVAALHGILEHSQGFRMSLPAGRGPQGFVPSCPHPVLTSPSTDTAPMRFCSSLISLVGPAMSDVPVSTMAWQPLAQKVTIPPSWMLEEGKGAGGICPALPAQPCPPSLPTPLTCPAGSASSPAG